MRLHGIKTHVTRVCTVPTFRRFITHTVEEASLGKQRMEGSVAEFWLLFVMCSEKLTSKGQFKLCCPDVLKF